jgi:hypothetical protein
LNRRRQSVSPAPQSASPALAELCGGRIISSSCLSTPNHVAQTRHSSCMLGPTPSATIRRRMHCIALHRVASPLSPPCPDRKTKAPLNSKIRNAKPNSPANPVSQRNPFLRFIGDHPHTHYNSHYRKLCFVMIARCACCSPSFVCETGAAGSFRVGLLRLRCAERYDARTMGPYKEVSVWISRRELRKEGARRRRDGSGSQAPFVCETHSR